MDSLQQLRALLNPFPGMNLFSHKPKFQVSVVVDQLPIDQTTWTVCILEYLNLKYSERAEVLSL